MLQFYATIITYKNVFIDDFQLKTTKLTKCLKTSSYSTTLVQQSNHKIKWNYSKIYGISN